jgi:hypothetical protein
LAGQIVYKCVCSQAGRLLQPLQGFDSGLYKSKKVRSIMANNLVQRTYPRIHLEAAIQCTPSNCREFRSTRSLNFSAGGLCYKTDQKLEPAEEVCIVMDNYAPGRFGPEGYRSYLAQICWIQPLFAPREDIFAAGARIIARSHEVLINATNEPQHLCDLCGALMPANLLQITDGNAHLCKHCYRHFLSIPEGKVRRCVDRFLMGNVV